ncbi:MAG: phosphonate C-P lyase system protein PhnG [Alphaproteobacteria bacterium]|nr:phosphonate C-P lyase system protein PhnG [Alphaproteobacteria bacterium]
MQHQRRWWMSVLARSSLSDLQDLAPLMPVKETYRQIKKPEIGTVMVEARAGGAGRRFNFGEATMTRCVVQLSSGELGFSYALGRDKAKAEQAALIDALLQMGQHDVKSAIMSRLRVIEAKLLADKDLRSRKAAATKVNFFTLVRGEG